MKLWKALFLLVMSFVIAPKASARPLSVLLMPCQSISENETPFTKDNNPYYPNLEFDNTDTDWDRLGIGYQKWLCDQLMAFSRSHDDLKIAVRFIPWDQALNEIKSLYELYDVVQVPSTWTAHLIDKGMLAKWEDDLDSSVYPPEILETCHIQGHHDFYAVPWQLDIRVLFYRMELTNDPNQLNTFSGFRKCLEGRKEVTGRAPFCIATDRDWDILHNTLRYFWRGRVIEKDFLWWRPVFDDDKAFEELKELLSLREDGLVHFASFSINKGLQSWYGQAQGLSEGKYDAVFSGFYMREFFDSNSDIDIRVAPLPEFGIGGKKTFLGGSHLAVTTSSVDRDSAGDARELIKWLTSYKTEVDMFKLTNAIPARRHALQEFFEQNPRWKLDLDTVLKSADVYPSIPAWAELENDVVLGNFHNIVRNIAGGQSEKVIKLHVRNAADKVRRILFADWLRRILPIAIAVLAISILTSTLLFWDRIRLALLMARGRKKVHEVSLGIHEVQKIVFVQLRESGHVLREEISEDFDSIIEHMEEIVKSACKRKANYDDLVTKIENVRQHIDAISDKLPASAELKQLFRETLKQLENLLGLTKAILALRKPSLSECTLKASVDYINGRLNLTLGLFYKGKRRGTIYRSEHREHYARVFELAVFRWGEQPNQNNGINRTDYFPILQQLPAKNPTASSQTIRNNVERLLITRFRQEVYDWLENKCKIHMTDHNGHPINKPHFMFEANLTENPPSYIFTLPSHFGIRDIKDKRFRCNLSLATYLIDDRIRSQPDWTWTSRILRTLRVLKACPRCELGWDTAAGYYQANNNLFLDLLGQYDLQDVVLEGRRMLNEKAARYRWAADILVSSKLGQSALDALAERAPYERDAPANFASRASELDGIASSLP